jgi:hypothetical protein
MSFSPEGSCPHQGMPSFDQSGRPLSFFEFWPMWAFYPPVFLYVVWLMIRFRGLLLPTVANPSFPGGGLVGESKAQILTLLSNHVPDWVAGHVVCHRNASDSIDTQVQSALSDLKRQGLDLPVVAKPDLGCRGVGVKLIRTQEQLEQYIGTFPPGADFILQKLVDCEGEAGVFYCRHPDAPRGEIISLTLKYFPYVYGDGTSTLRSLILNDPRAGRLAHLYMARHASRLDSIPAKGEAIRLAFAGSHSRGAIFRNGNRLITSSMTDRFDALAKSIPGFYFGRFDIRFHDFESVQRGKDFTIVEANGAGAESTHIWDRQTTLLDAWRSLMRQNHILFAIGHANRKNGHKPLSWSEFRKWHLREKELTALYPATD